MATIGFVGLGQMGGAMSRNLMRAGHQLEVFDIAEDAWFETSNLAVVDARALGKTGSIVGIGGAFVRAHGEVFKGIDPVTSGYEAGLTTPPGAQASTMRGKGFTPVGPASLSRTVSARFM